MTKRQKEIIGLLVIIFSIVSAISILTYSPIDHPSGLDRSLSPFSFIGLWIGFLFYNLLGYPSIALSIISLLFGFILFTDFKTKVRFTHISYILIISLYFSALMAFIADISNNIEISHFFSGFFGSLLIKSLNILVGIPGVIILLFFVLILIITNIFKISIYNLFSTIFNYTKLFFYFLYSTLLKISNGFLKLIKKRKIEDEQIINDNSDLDMNVSDDSDNLVLEVTDDQDVERNTIEDGEDSNDSLIENNEAVIEKNDDIGDDHSDDEIVVEEESYIEEGNLDSEQKTISNYFKYKLPKLEYLKDPIEIVKQNDDELRAKSDSKENIFYYIQYAHARIFSLEKKFKETHSNLKMNIDSIKNNGYKKCDVLIHEISKYPNIINKSSRTLQPHLIIFYLRDLSQLFHSYYNDNHVLSESEENIQSIIFCLSAVKQTIANGLKVLGITPMQKM